MGTTPLVLPDGVAAKVEEGRQVLVNLHVFNTSREPLSGRSGVKVKLIDASEVTHEAQVVLMGTEDLAIPARSSDHVHEGACEIEVPGTLFAIMPHMHQLGTYMRVTLGDTVLHDAPFTFDEQRYGETFSQPVAGGERLNVRCTYDNPTDAPVGYGDSSLEEMCYALVYRFPPSDPFDVVCADD